jgi:hypothetical protein
MFLCVSGPARGFKKHAPGWLSEQKNAAQKSGGRRFQTVAMIPLI